MNFKTALNKVGWNGKLLANVLPWIGEPNHIHRCIQYNSNDQYVIQQQLDNMQACEVDGVILTWRGISVAGGWDQQVASKMAFQCAQRKMLFAYLLDPGILRYKPSATTSNEQELINNLNDPSVQQVISNGFYVPEVYLFDFLTGFTVNWAQVQAAVKGNIVPLKRNAGYAWPCLQPLSTVKQWHNNAAIKVPGVAFGFNDAGAPLPLGAKPSNFSGQRDYALSVWASPGDTVLTAPARVNDPQAGSYFLGCVESIGLAPLAKGAPYASIVTWNDYDEGTAVEQMISALTGIKVGQ